MPVAFLGNDDIRLYVSRRSQPMPFYYRNADGDELIFVHRGEGTVETDLLWEGRLATQAPEIDGVTLINDFEGAEPRQGEIRRLHVTEAHDYDLVGTLLPGTEAPPRFSPAPLINIAV